MDEKDLMAAAGNAPAAAPLTEVKEVELTPEESAVRLANDAAKANERYENLNRKFAEQGNEVGFLRQKMEELTQKLQASPVGQQQNAETFDSMISTIQKQVETGEISISQGLARTAEITSKIAAETATSKSREITQQLLADRDSKALQNEFLKANPDFVTLHQAGELDKVKAANPLLDNLGAYFLIKGQSEYERGKKEMAELQKGTKVAESVLARPGANVVPVNKPKGTYTDEEILSSMQNTLAKVRASENPG